jgi:hypothetical protein
VRMGPRYRDEVVGIAHFIFFLWSSQSSESGAAGSVADLEVLWVV